MLKGGQEAPTKPKGRPKKNSIPTTEEIEAEERRMKLEEEDKLRRVAEKAVPTHREASELEPQAFSSVQTTATEIQNPVRAMEGPERRLPLLMQSETHAAS